MGSIFSTQDGEDEKSQQGLLCQVCSSIRVVESECKIEGCPRIVCPECVESHRYSFHIGKRSYSRFDTTLSIIACNLCDRNRSSSSKCRFNHRSRMKWILTTWFTGLPSEITMYFLNDRERYEDECVYVCDECMDDLSTIVSEDVIEVQFQCKPISSLKSTTLTTHRLRDEWLTGDSVHLRLSDLSQNEKLSAETVFKYLSVILCQAMSLHFELDRRLLPSILPPAWREAQRMFKDREKRMERMLIDHPICMCRDLAKLVLDYVDHGKSFANLKLDIVTDSQPQLSVK